MKVVVIGAAGLIGQERIKAIQTLNKNNADIEILACDTNIKQLAQKTKYEKGIEGFFTIEETLKEKPDWVFIATPNDVSYAVAKQAFESGANVLLEKPMGRNLEEANKILALKPDHLKLNIGHNYRFFDGVGAALYDAKNGKFGKLISVNLILAHGNAPGMEKSWHLDPVRRGSLGADLGVHLFDLILQLSFGNVEIRSAQKWQGSFWNTGIEEEAHMILTDDNNIIYNAQISYNRWRSNFRMEINGTEGYGVVEGRGRSFGQQSYRVGKRWAWKEENKNQSDTEIYIIRDNDCNNSFVKETALVLGMGDRLENTCKFEPCDHIGAHKIMQLLDQYERLI